MKLTPSHRVYGLAAVMLVTLILCTRMPGGVGPVLSSLLWQLLASRTCSPFVRFSPRSDSRAASSWSGWWWLHCGMFHFCDAAGIG